MKDLPLVKILSSDSSSRRALVLIPGLGAGLLLWSRLKDDLFEDTDCDVYVANAPWMDTASMTQSAKTMPEFAKELALALAEYEEVFVAAHSVGCYLAVELGLQLGARCPQILLVNGATKGVAEFLDSPFRVTLAHSGAALRSFILLVGVSLPLPRWMRSWIVGNVWLSRLLLGVISNLVGAEALRQDSAVRILAGNIGHAHVGRALWVNRHHWRVFLNSARQLEAAVVLLAKKFDPVATEAETAFFARTLKRATVVHLDGAGHCIPLENRSALVHHVKMMLQRDYQPSTGLRP